MVKKKYCDRYGTLELVTIAQMDADPYAGGLRGLRYLILEDRKRGQLAQIVEFPRDRDCGLPTRTVEVKDGEVVDLLEFGFTEEDLL